MCRYPPESECLNAMCLRNEYWSMSLALRTVSCSSCSVIDITFSLVGVKHIYLLDGDWSAEAGDPVTHYDYYVPVHPDHAELLL